jgi:hypothetical protein
MIRLDVANPTVGEGEAKAEIARVQGTEVARKELYRVAVREDGKAVREDDAEPESLDDDLLALEEGAVVAMAVKDSPFLWRTFPDELVELSEGGTVATQLQDHEVEFGGDIYSFSRVTTGVELTEGRHYWEVELLSGDVEDIFVGISRPNLDRVGDYLLRECTDGWFIHANYGHLYGNGKQDEDGADMHNQGDCMGVLLDLNNGSLLFFKNGVQDGPGYPAGSVTGPVVASVGMGRNDDKVRLHADVAFPAGHVQ